MRFEISTDRQSKIKKIRKIRRVNQPVLIDPISNGGGDDQQDNSYAYDFNFIYLSVHPCDRKAKGGCEQKCVKDDNKDKFHCQCTAPEFKVSKTNPKECDKGKLAIL